MSMKAVAVLQVAHDKLKDHDGDLTLKALEDGAILFTEASLRDTEPEDIGALVRNLVGNLLDDHGDERGIPIYPDKLGTPKAKTYDGVIDELGEMLEWVPAPRDTVVDPAGFDPAAVGLPPGMQMPPGLEAMAQNMLGGADLGDLQREMMGNPQAMQAAMAMAQEMFADPSKMQGLMEAVGQMFGGAPGAPEGAEAPEGEAPAMPDLGALGAQAQALMAQNPDLVNSLMGGMAGAKPPAEEAEASAEDDEFPSGDE